MKATLNRYRSLTPLLNYIHNLNRRNSDREKLFGTRLRRLPQVREFNRQLGIEMEEPGRGWKAQGKSWPLAVFGVHKNFYCDPANLLLCEP